MSYSDYSSTGRVSMAFSCCRCYECKINNCYTTEIGEHDERDIMLIPYGIEDIDDAFLKKYIIEDEDSDDTEDYEFEEDEFNIPSKYQKLIVSEEIYKKNINDDKYDDIYIIRNFKQYIKNPKICADEDDDIYY